MYTDVCVPVCVYMCETEKLSAPSTPFAQSHAHSKWERGLLAQRHTRVLYEKWSVAQERFASHIGALLWWTEGHHSPLSGKDEGRDSLSGLDLELEEDEASWLRSKKGASWLRAGDTMGGDSSLTELKDQNQNNRKYFASTSVPES